MERLYEIHTAGTYDLIVVDTPPTRNAIDFLEAPERMADFFSSRLLRWLTAPYQVAVVQLRVQALLHAWPTASWARSSSSDIAEFFMLFQTMYDGFVERAEAVTRTLADKRTTFVVVCTLESAPVREAEFFIDALNERKLHLGGARAQQGPALVPAPHQRPRRWPGRSAPMPSVGQEAGRRRRGPGTQTARVLTEVGESFLNYQVVAKREAEQQAELGAVPEVVATVPYFDVRHPRPRRPAQAGREHLAVGVPGAPGLGDGPGQGPWHSPPRPGGDPVAPTMTAVLRTPADESSRLPLSLAELARQFTALPPGAVVHLQRLVATWDMLADFCFSDLLLLVPVADATGELPGHGPGAAEHVADPVPLATWSARPSPRPNARLIARSYALGEIIEGEVTDDVVRERVRVLCIPVRFQDEVIAVLSRESAPIVGRSPGELERIYVALLQPLRPHDLRRRVPVRPG